MLCKIEIGPFSICDPCRMHPHCAISYTHLITLSLISRAELFCNICSCGSASKCCRIVLFLKLLVVGGIGEERESRVTWECNSIISPSVRKKEAGEEEGEEEVEEGSLLAMEAC